MLSPLAQRPIEIVVVVVVVVVVVLGSAAAEVIGGSTGEGEVGEGCYEHPLASRHAKLSVFTALSLLVIAIFFSFWYNVAAAKSEMLDISNTLCTFALCGCAAHLTAQDQIPRQVRRFRCLCLHFSPSTKLVLALFFIFWGAGSSGSNMLVFAVFGKRRFSRTREMAGMYETFRD